MDDGVRSKYLSVSETFARQDDRCCSTREYLLVQRVK